MCDPLALKKRIRKGRSVKDGSRWSTRRLLRREGKLLRAMGKLLPKVL